MKPYVKLEHLRFSDPTAYFAALEAHCGSVPRHADSWTESCLRRARGITVGRFAEEAPRPATTAMRSTTVRCCSARRTTSRCTITSGAGTPTGSGARGISASEPGGAVAVAEALPALGRLPQAGRASTARLRPDRPRSTRWRAPPARGRRSSRTSRSRSSAVPSSCDSSQRKMRDEPGLDVPAAAARRSASLAPLPAPARRRATSTSASGRPSRCRPASGGRLLQPPHRGRGRPSWAGTSRCTPRRSTPRTSSAQRLQRRGLPRRSSRPTTADGRLLGLYEKCVQADA